MSYKTAFVTVGATASFDALIAVCLMPETFTAFTSLGYANLRLQYGNGQGKHLLDSYLASPNRNTDLSISGFDFTGSLDAEIAAADLVISHAGAGTILDALRLVKKLIAVPNTALMDNHQKELAEELERQGYLVEGSLDSLSKAIYIADTTQFKHFPPSGSKKFVAIVDEEMGIDNLD